MDVLAAEGFVAAAEAVADAAGAVIRPYFRRGVTADLKSDDSPVTIADRSAEQAMRAVLAESCPGHGIIGEEFGASDQLGGLCWVLDPIDGTRAFITGRPVFGTLVALLEDGVPILGVIDQPVTGERWIGVRGQPTRFSGGFGGEAGCRACPELGGAELSCTSPEVFDAADLAGWDRLRAAAGRTSFGGDCYAYGLLALGQIDVIAEAGMKIWDWAALVPVIEGAGGRLTDWQGRALHAGSDGRTLAVGDPALLGRVMAVLAA
jgi:histidinol phosphatase-like enzyme (inositol monophosphatase family)